MLGAVFTTAVAVVIGLTVPVDRMRSTPPPPRSTVQPPRSTVQPPRSTQPPKSALQPPRKSSSSVLLKGGKVGKSGSCAICLLHGSLEETRECGHSFHAACVEPWVRQGLTSYCPICRVSQPEIAATTAPVTGVTGTQASAPLSLPPAAQDAATLATGTLAPSTQAAAATLDTGTQAIATPEIAVSIPLPAASVSFERVVRGGGKTYDKFNFM